METLILFAEQATTQSKSFGIGDIAFYGIIIIIVSCIAYFILSVVIEERNDKRRSYAIGHAMKYMDDVANKDYNALDSKYDKKDTKPKRR